MTATNVVLDVINQEGGDGTTTGRAEAAELTYREHIKKLAWALMHNSQLENRHSTATPQGTHGPVAAAAGKRASPCKGGGGGGDGWWRWRRRARVRGDAQAGSVFQMGISESLSAQLRYLQGQGQFLLPALRPGDAGVRPVLESGHQLHGDAHPLEQDLPCAAPK